MESVRIISNNPQVESHYPEYTHVVEGDVNAIFLKARDMIHQGSKLINHPLYGSVKPNETPYRSLVMTMPDTCVNVDFDSLRLIEEAASVLKKLPPKKIMYTDSILQDYQAIDFALLFSAIDTLPPQYYMR